MTKEDFSLCILGKSPNVFWKHVEDDSLPTPTKKQVSAITSIERNGAYVHVVYHVGTLSRRWAGTLALREQRKRPASALPAHPPIRRYTPEERAQMDADLRAEAARLAALPRNPGKRRGRPLNSTLKSARV